MTKWHTQTTRKPVMQGRATHQVEATSPHDCVSMKSLWWKSIIGQAWTRGFKQGQTGQVYCQTAAGLTLHLSRPQDSSLHSWILRPCPGSAEQAFQGHSAVREDWYVSFCSTVDSSQLAYKLLLGLTWSASGMATLEAMRAAMSVTTPACNIQYSHGRSI